MTLTAAAAGAGLDDATAAAAADRAQAAFDRGAPWPRAARVLRLRALEAALRRHEKPLLGALAQDLGKPLHEAYTSELGLLYAEIHLALRSLRGWMKPRRCPVPLAIWPARAQRQAEPRGAALIISPWNYPLQLAVGPLIGALAAGCTAVLKPSEQAPATSAALADCLAHALPEDEVQVVQGAASIAEHLLRQRWGLIFFVGSTRVGREVAAAAARQLTPVVLELGGKSPCLVDEQTDLATAARRIAWGKFHNAGQTCVAPDYVLVHHKVEARFLQLLGEAVLKFYGRDPAQSPDYARIINDTHLQRLLRLRGGGRIVLGGESDRAQRYLAPTVLTDVDLDHPLMHEEIFGPLLPVVPVADLDQAAAFVRARPIPLSLSLFSDNQARIAALLPRLPSGSAVINDVLLHMISLSLPVGGRGQSGMGSFHGKASFDAFSHSRAVLDKPCFPDLALRYPPYRTPLSWLRRLIG